MFSGGNVELMTGVFTPSRRGRRPLAKGTHGGVYINLAYLMRLVRSPVISFMVKQATPYNEIYWLTTGIGIRDCVSYLYGN